MKTHLAALVVALLLAAVATQIYVTLFAGDALMLLVSFFLVATVTALVTLRFNARQQSSAPRARRSRSAYTPIRHRQVGPPAGAKRESGTVKWFSRDKGFGFIVRENGDDIFVHYRSIRRSGRERPGLDDGQAVNFVAVERQRGWQAEDVVPEGAQGHSSQ